MLDQFDFNIFINGAAIDSSQIFAGVFGYLTITKLKRRVSGGISFGIITACALVLVFIWDQDQSDADDMGIKITVLIFIFLIQMVITNSFNNFTVYFN